jgi:hypothetical protein
MDSAQPLARCFLRQEGDARYQCVLTTQSLEVTHQGKKEYFELSGVASVAILTRKILFPIVLGGILTPLAGLALFTSYGHIHLLFGLFFLGLFLFYYGITGTQSLVITTPWKSFDYFLPTVSPQMQAFARYAANVTTYADGYCFFFAMEEDAWEKVQETDRLNTPPLRLYYREEQHLAQGPVLVQLDPLLALHSLQLVKNPADGSLVPYTQGVLPLQALSRLNPPA